MYRHVSSITGLHLTETLKKGISYAKAMETKRHKLTWLLVLYFIYVLRTTSSEEVLPKLNGSEIKILAYQVSRILKNISMTLYFK